MTNFLGTLIVTAYVATGHPAANGKLPVADVTCAGPRCLPLGTKVYVEGVGLRTVTDRTARRYDGRVDLFYGDRGAALRWGKQERKVWVVQPK